MTDEDYEATESMTCVDIFENEFVISYTEE